jgi:hypothetical protein
MVAVETPTKRNVSELTKVVREVPPALVAAVTQLLDSVAGNEERAIAVAHVVNLLTRSVADGNHDGWLKEDQGSGLAVLVGWLNRPEVLAELQRSVNPITMARLRGLAVKERLLAAEGGALSAKDIAKALGITRQAVDARRKRGALIGLTMGKRGYLYPSWQVGLEGLELVLNELQGYDPWAQLAFIMTPNVWLEGKRPLDVLRNGDILLALEAARTYGQQIAA